MARALRKLGDWRTIYIFIVALLGLYLAGRTEYLLFHTLIEMVTIAIAACAFIIAWNGQRLHPNSYLLVLGLGFGSVAALTLIHVLSYAGMDIMRRAPITLSSQLWIASRGVLALALLAAPLVMGRKLRRSVVLFGYIVVTALLFGAIFAWRIFPVTFIAGPGVTLFKTFAEYAICLILAFGLVLLWGRAEAFDRRVVHYLSAGMIFFIAAELTFSSYLNLYGLSNVIGHLLTLIAFAYFYLAIVRTGFSQPLQLLFRDLKESEQALRAAAENWQQTFASVPDLIMVLDREHRIMRANQAMAQAAGLSELEMIGRRCFEIVHQTSGPPSFCPHARLLEDGESHQEEITEPRLGTVWELTVTPLRDGAGQVIGSVHVAHEITERKRAEEALIESRKDLAQAQEVGQIGSWRLEVGRNILTWSEENYRIFGLPQGAPLTYEAFLECVHPDDREYVDTRWQAGLRGEPYDIEHRIVAAGEVKWVREKAYLELDAAGQLLGGFGITQDITARKRAEEQMAWLASFPRQNPAPVMEVEADGKPVYVNLATQKLLPDLGEKGRNHPWLAGLEEVGRRFREGQENRVLRDVRIGDSWYQQLFMPVQEGRRVRIYATDITPRKQAEEALLRERNRMRLLADTAAQLLAAPDPLSVVKEICGEVLQFLDCQMFFVFLADEQSGRMHLAAYQGLPEAKEKELEWLEHGTIFCGCETPDGECLVVENIGASGEPELALLRKLALQAFACHPIKIGGRVLGTLAFGCSNRERFGKEEISLMKIITDQVTLAVVRQQSEQALQEAKEKLEIRVEERTAQLKQTVDALQVEAVEREQAENAAAAERRRFHDVLETVPAYVVLLTPDYHVAYANRVFRERFGESGGRRCYEFLFHRSEPCEICETYAVLKTKGPHHWEWTGPDKRNYDIYDFPFTDTDGSPLILEMGVDITELKMAQQHLLAYQEKLEQLVKARTAALENTNAELLAAERARVQLAETLVSEIGHRTKNNLAIVAGLLQMQMDREGEATPGPELIRDAVTRILSFASLHEQMYQSQADSIELVDAIKRIAEIDRQALSAGDVEIAVEGEAMNYPSGVGTTLCVVANELLTNAIKHSGRPDGGRRVEVKLSSCQGGLLALSVWNSGKAIAKDFDIRKSSRTGLGLVRAIVVEQYGGAFTLAPEKGGTLARIVLSDARLCGGS